jgi:hypothetical protein
MFQHNQMDELLNLFTNKELVLAESYIQKWERILSSTHSIEKRKAETAILNTYKLLDLPRPNLVFLPSPCVDASVLLSLNLSNCILPKSILKDRLRQSIWDRTDEIYFNKPDGQSKYIHLDRSERFRYLCEIIYSKSALSLDHPEFVDSYIFFEIHMLEFENTNPWFYDLHINSTSSECNLEIWDTWKSLCEECPYLIAFENTCIVIERPIKLYLDREQLAHAEGKAAIKFVDNYQIYCNHGTIIPSKYGEIHPDNWQSLWILAEEQSPDNKELVNILLCNIGYKKFCQELPNNKYRYWGNYEILIAVSIDKIFSWLFFYHDDLYNYFGLYGVDKRSISEQISQIERLINNFPSKLSQELYTLSKYCRQECQIAPNLYFHPLSQSIQTPTIRSRNHIILLFHGDRQEIYYVLCDNEERLISPVYCQFPDEEPVIYAECVTSLIVTIAQCYQEGAYYIAIDEETGERSIEQDLDKIEPIFEKFNPDRIDNWRKIWKS